MEERQWYIQLLAFSYGPAIEILHLFFENKLLQNSSFIQFLDDTRNKHILFHEFKPTVQCCECINLSLAAAHKRGHLFKSQFDLLYIDTCSSPPNHVQWRGKLITQHCLCKYSAKTSVSIEDVDISLLYAIVNNCCSLPSQLLSWIKDLKEVRNILVHLGNGHIAETNYKIQWNTLQIACLGLAGIIGNSFVRVFLREIERLTDCSIDALKDIVKKSKENLSELHHVLNGVKPLQTVIAESTEVMKEVSVQQKEHTDTLRAQGDDMKDVKSKLDFLLYAQFGELKTVSEVKRQDGDSIERTSVAGENTSSEHDILIRLETPSSWNKEKIEQKLNERLNKDANCSEDELHLVKFKFKCLILTTRASTTLINDKPALVEAIGKFLKDIFEDCEIDTRIPETLYITIDVYCPIISGIKTENNETDLTIRPAKSAMKQEEKDDVVLPDIVTKQHIDKMDITDPRENTQGKDKLRGTMKMAAQNDYFVTCKYCSQTFVCDKCMTTGVRTVSLEAKLNKIFGIIKDNFSNAVTKAYLNVFSSQQKIDEGVLLYGCISLADMRKYETMMREELWKQVINNMTNAIVKVVDFAKQIPGFCDFSESDQIILLKNGVFEALLILCSKVYDPSGKKVVFGGKLLSLRAFTSINREEQEFLNELFETVQRLKYQSLNDTEMALLLALVLTQPDLHGVMDAEGAKKLHIVIRNSLQFEICKSHSRKRESMNILFDITKELQRLNTKHATLLYKFSLSAPNIQFPPVYKEVFSTAKLT
ncbi:nuclear receptor subfamily 1 group F member 4 [Mytilus galloprovincialis]|uniref:Nuclear receptor subfamily 1 group F member 4 n=2 Tax=Mytilus galloprovincialis TaxID=29158 RepID=A0A8B6GE42_MYTGA|nr:nuclear receptor subfamily 1 group F member 4 [Mytilus galloprovincialis]